MPENVNTSALEALGANSLAIEDNRPTMIKVNHVSMVFNMASEQLNSLKEYAIKIMRRELFFEGFTALDDVSFEIKKGDVFGIIGTNGSGKSTLLKIIAGVLEPTEGSCDINGNIAPLIELGAGFDTELSARENIYLNGALLGYSKQFIDDHFDEIVDFAEIEKFLDMPLKNYSSGMVARIAFAIATVIVPEILVVDEVLSVGDFMFQKKCEDRINELIEKHGVTVLIVSHSNAQIERMCNKAIWIEKGHTRMLGDAASVCRVYGGLGGRTGSADAERRVFESLKASCEQENLSSYYRTIAGENADSTNAKTILEGWDNTPIEAVALVSGATHVNAIVANALAGSLGAPILSTKPDSIPDAVQRILYDSKPSTVFTFDFGRNAEEAFTELSKLPWHPAVISFDSDDPFELSRAVFEYGANEKLWGDEAALIDFDDNPESLIAASYLYDRKCPVLVTFGEDKRSFNSTLTSILERNGIKKATVFGSTPCPGIETESNVIAIDRVCGQTRQETCLKISGFVFDRAQASSAHEPVSLCVASLSLAQWPELLSCGALAAKLNTALLLEDQTNLDSIAACLEFIHTRHHSIGELISIGGQTGLTQLDLELLSHELATD